MNTDCADKNSGGIKSILLVNFSDVVWRDGQPIRMKRKYGKFKRTVIKLKTA